MMKTINSLPSQREKKSDQSTLNDCFSTPTKSQFKPSLKRHSNSGAKFQTQTKSPISLLTLASKSTRNANNGKLLKFNTEILSLNEPSLNNNVKRTIALFDKIKPVLPVLTNPSALNNFIIRGFKPSKETSEYIQSTKNKMKISDQFFDLKQKRVKTKTKNHLEAFERIKRCTGFVSDSIAYRPNYNDSNYRMKPSNEDIIQIEENNKRLLESKTRTEGKNLADMVLSIDKNENIELNDEYKSSIEVSFHNLHNVIALRKIIRGKGRYNEENETLGISNVNKLRHERHSTEYEMARTLKHFKAPKFVKNKFGKNTVKQFRGVNGKFFGVIC